MRLREGFVEVKVDSIEAHQAGRGNAQDGVKVGTVVVHLATCVVNDLTRFLDVCLKEPESVGIGYHHGSGGFVGYGSKRRQVHSTVS